MDSGASDHMTGDARIFSTFTTCDDSLKVRIADGSLSKVMGIGTVRVTDSITLTSVLLVPNSTAICYLLVS